MEPLRGFPTISQRSSLIAGRPKIREDAWQERLVHQTGEVVRFPRFVDFLQSDLREGLNADLRAVKRLCDNGFGVGPGGLGVYLDFADAIRRVGRDTITERYDNLLQMYERITDEDPYKVPMRIYPAVHYTMGGLWVD